VARFSPFFVSFFESSASPSGRIHSFLAIRSSARICSPRSPFGCFFTSATMLFATAVRSFVLPAGDGVMAILHGHEAGNGGYRQGKPVHHRAGPRPYRSILIVEDDELVAKLLRRLAAPYGEPVTAASLAEARRALGKPAASWMALVIDEGLPDGSGLDALEFARRRGIKAPAVLYTGQLSPPLVIRASKLDARYLCKEGGREELQRFLSTRSFRRRPARIPSRTSCWSGGGITA
jgi:CheY-like chemotaxis protein